MTGQTFTLTDLTSMVFKANYDELKKWSGNDDILHSSYIQVYERLQRGSFATGDTINHAVKNVLNYYRKTIVNRRRMNGKQMKDNRPLEDSYLVEVESIMTFNDDCEKDDLVFQNQLKYNNKMVFQYLELTAEPFEIYILKLYYFTGMSYDQIARSHNLKNWSVNNILKKLRADLRNNLQKYINKMENLEEVQSFLNEGGCTNNRYHIAMELYKKVYPEKYKNICKGCRSKSLRIIQADFQIYLKLNK